MNVLRPVAVTEYGSQMHTHAVSWDAKCVLQTAVSTIGSDRTKCQLHNTRSDNFSDLPSHCIMVFVQRTDSICFFNNRAPILWSNSQRQSNKLCHCAKTRKRSSLRTTWSISSLTSNNNNNNNKNYQEPRKTWRLPHDTTFSNYIMVFII